MIHKTRGIVFRFTKFRETSIIVTIFTELFGLQSYIVNGVRSKSAKNKIALYQPLTLLHLVVYHREHAHIERIKEISCLHPYTTITANVKKSTVAIFITEVLNKCVKDESHAKDMFEFLCHSLITFDTLEAGYENFHLIFILKLSRYLGFGVYQAKEVIAGRIISEENEHLLNKLINADYDNHIALTNVQRKDILDLLLAFYADHMDNVGELRSVQILRDVLS